MKSLKLLLRFAIVGGLLLVLLVPLLLIRSVIKDRERYRDEAVQRVAQSSAGEQRFVGPLRYIPWTREVEVKVRDDAGNTTVQRRRETGHLVQAPARLRIEGVLVPSVRRVGLFKVPVYVWQAQVRATFAPMRYEPSPGRVYGQPYLALGIADVRGLAGEPSLAVAGRALELENGSGGLEPTTQGMHAPLPMPGDARDGTLPALEDVVLDLRLSGTRSLSVVPAGDSNQVTLRSSWPHPSFGGEFLPVERQVDANGFRAQWALSSLATRAQAQLIEGTRPDALRVDLFDPVDAYTQADRASKYGVLFVLLTFVGFVLLELTRQLRIHPVQYLLVGLALAIFFLLLLSLSEVVPFWQAYGMSAAACIGLQFFYLAGVLHSRSLAAGFAALLTVLYGVLYGLLVSEDNALLMGSLLLFGILAAIMWLTRRLDWYELGAQLR
ncbi:cell envelope integrity protein CreD [[Pseudomonas] boreopolis]|uniref:cell envelope integrity protein CreD n=1 Tax=Xanthomonas boreopolis TaxID=86183 RepID=UPI003D5A6043